MAGNSISKMVFWRLVQLPFILLAVYTATFWFVAEYAGRLPDNPFIYFQF